jgi:beta-lactamase class A
VRLAAYEAYVADPPDGAAPAGDRRRAGAAEPRRTCSRPIRPLAARDDGRRQDRQGARARRGPAGLAYGHKTGTGQDLFGRTAGFNDVGILTAPDGRSYAVAVMIGDTSRPIRERQLLMQAVASAIVAHHGNAEFRRKR